MSFLVSLFLAAVLGTVCPLVPKPQSAEAVEGVFFLDGSARICYENGLEEPAQLLQGELLRWCGIASAVSEKGKKAAEGRTITYRRFRGKGPEEQYSIKMRPQAVEIHAWTRKGFINGTMAFVQLARLAPIRDRVVEMDCWNIDDSPRYSWRGFMLDESRHFFGTRKVKQILDWMSLYRMNRFHWHLTDEPAWRIEIKKYPRLALVGGIGSWGDPDVPARFYTQDEIREIVSYARERGIEIIPEIDMPGHATAAVRAYPEFDGGGSEKRASYTFNPGKEGTYAFLADILAEVDALFPSQIVHLGGDEVSYANSQWWDSPDVKALMEREGFTNLKEVELYFDRRVADSLFALGNKIAAWDEVVEAELDPSKTISYFWRPNRTDMLQKALDQGCEIVFCPRLPMYFDYAQDSLQVHGHDWWRFGPNTYRNVYDFETDSFDVKYPSDAKILGVQANLWTEKVYTEDRLDYMLFPRIAALAETCWTNRENKDLEDFNTRLKGQFVLYRKDGIYFCNPFDRAETGEPMR